MRGIHSWLPSGRNYLLLFLDHLFLGCIVTFPLDSLFSLSLSVSFGCSKDYQKMHLYLMPLFAIVPGIFTQMNRLLSL